MGKRGGFGAAWRRFRRNKEDTVAIEYALILPVLMTLSFGIMEISLCMASLVTLEGGLKEASRYGITEQIGGGLTTSQKAQVPTAFQGSDDRKEMIGYILSQNTLNLINLNTATISTQVFSSFSAIQNGEPYSDNNPKNGHYDLGESFSDMNCNGVWDGPGASSGGSGTNGNAGAAGEIVVYTVNYDWQIMTPFVGPLLGKLQSGKYVIPMQASAVVKNEPNLSGSSYCS